VTEPRLALDTKNLERVRQHKWRISQDGYWIIVGTNTHMSHFLMGEPPRGYEWDHADGDPSNNTEANLRLATRQQQQQNRGKGRGKYSSRYKGVYWEIQKSRWRAAIYINYERKHLGYFVSEEDAARAYDRAALECFGEFARLNFDGEGVTV